MWKVRYYIPGSLFILAAVLIVAVPEILLVLIATFLIMVGMGALYIGHMIRKSQIEPVNSTDWFLDNGSHGGPTIKARMFKLWRRIF